MYLKEVYIKNFRSIKECKVSLDDFTVFIGENNAGKTTILDAIRIGLNKAINRHSFDEYDFHMDENVNSPKESDGIKIIYHFEEKDEGEWDGYISDTFMDVIQYLKESPNKASVLIEVNAIFNDVTGDIETKTIFLNQNYEEITGKSQNIVGKFLQLTPVFYLQALRDIKDTFSSKSPLWGRFMKKVSISKEDLEELQNQISGLNNDIITKDENLKELVNELDKIQNVMDFQGEDIVSIDAVPLKTWDLLSKAQVVINNGSTSYNFPIDKHGQGTQSVAAILLFKAYVKILLNEMSREEAEAILTLEEPEAHLHPQAVRSLHKSIDEIECQKIITTHSPYFIQNMDLKNLRYVRKENGETKIAKIFDRYVFSVSDIPEGLIRLSSRFSNVIEVDGNLNIVTIKDPINRCLEGAIRGCCHPSDETIDAVIDNAYRIFNMAEICNLNTYVQRSRGEILFARKWLLYEGQSEDVILPYFAKILGKDFDASGVSGIIYRSNGSAGPFAKLAKVLSIPWVMLADNDEQGRQAVGEVRNCGYSEDVISSQVLLNSTTDFENELATSNRIFTDYESIVVEEITQDIIELKNSGDVDEYKKEIVKLVQKGKVVNAYKLLDLWSGNALSADDIPEVYVNAILGVCE